jgi:hypothetical protein
VESKAKGAGLMMPESVRFLIERDLLAAKTFDEILRPVRKDFRQSGITPEQLNEIVKRARKATRSKHGGTRQRPRRWSARGLSMTATCLFGGRFRHGSGGSLFSSVAITKNWWGCR